MTLHELLVEKGIAEEIRWAENDELFIWIDYINMCQFMEGLEDIFGNEISINENLKGNLQSTGICIDLVKALDDYLYIEELEEQFPKDKYGEDVE